MFSFFCCKHFHPKLKFKSKSKHTISDSSTDNINVNEKILFISSSQGINIKYKEIFNKHNTKLVSMIVNPEKYVIDMSINNTKNKNNLLLMKLFNGNESNIIGKNFNDIKNINFGLLNILNNIVEKVKDTKKINKVVIQLNEHDCEKNILYIIFGLPILDPCNDNELISILIIKQQFDDTIFLDY